CSSAGDDALWALGELALERGDYSRARMAWARVNPATAGGLIAYPGSPIPLAEVRARLALAAIREGDLRAAERAVEAIRTEHGEAQGRLGGRTVVLGQWLGEELARTAATLAREAAAREWPTLYGNNRRTSVSPATAPRGAGYEQRWSAPIDGAPGASRSAGPTVFPVAAGNVAYVPSGRSILSINLAAPQGTPQVLATWDDEDAAVAAARLTINDGLLFALNPAANRIVGFDLQRDAAIALDRRGDGASYCGHVVADGSQVLACEITPGPAVKASVVCFDRWRGDGRWKRTLGWTFAEADASRPSPLVAELSYDGAVVYAGTSLGMIAAFRAEDGEPLWLRTYDRRRAEGSAASCACRIAGSLLVALPADSAEVLALDAATGDLRWSRARSSSGDGLLAVDEQHVLMQGERLGRLQLMNGDADPLWGASVKGCAGAAAVAGELIFWPTTRDIRLVDRRTGEPTGESAPLAAPGGANLAVVEFQDKDGRLSQLLLAAGAAQLTAYRRIEAADGRPAAADRPADVNGPEK
ncbi:MAG: hypothetical protein DCC67_17005, partial [Planctomycetota bacterium]